jgi:hypothetical protein
MSDKPSTTPTSPVKRKSQRINNKVKTGRRASEDERILAKALLSHYEIHQDISILVSALMRFSQNGSFVLDDKKQQDFFLALQHRAQRSAGLTVEKSTEKLAEKNNTSVVTVKRRISTAAQNPIESDNPVLNFLQAQLGKPIEKKKK